MYRRNNNGPKTLPINGMFCKILSHTKHPNKQYFATTTLKFGLAGCSVTISYVCSNPSGPSRPYSGTTRQGHQIREPATPTRDAYLRPKSQSTTVYHTETKPRSGLYGSRSWPTHFHIVFCRQEQDTAGQG